MCGECVRKEEHTEVGHSTSNITDPKPRVSHGARAPSQSLPVPARPAVSEAGAWEQAGRRKHRLAHREEDERGRAGPAGDDPRILGPEARLRRRVRRHALPRRHRPQPRRQPAPLPPPWPAQTRPPPQKPAPEGAAQVARKRQMSRAWALSTRPSSARECTAQNTSHGREASSDAWPAPRRCRLLAT